MEGWSTYETTPSVQIIYLIRGLFDEAFLGLSLNMKGFKVTIYFPITVYFISKHLLFHKKQHIRNFVH